MAWYHVGSCDCPIGCCDCGDTASVDWVYYNLNKDKIEVNPIRAFGKKHYLFLGFL